MSEEAQPIEILLVEDNVADAELTEHALRKKRLANALHVVETGEEALDFLYRRGRFEDAPCPTVVLLDLNLPGLSGHEVLEHIKTHPELKSIPVIVLTSSERSRDVDTAYALHANSYIVKPVDFSGFVNAVCELSDYWFQLVRRPGE